MEKFHISMPLDLRQEIERRGPRSTIIARDLERYYALLRRAARELDALTDDERLLIRNATISTIFEPISIRNVGMAIEDAYPHERTLIDKLVALSDVAKYALVDWIETVRESD